MVLWPFEPPEGSPITSYKEFGLFDHFNAQNISLVKKVINLNGLSTLVFEVNGSIR